MCSYATKTSLYVSPKKEKKKKKYGTTGENQCICCYKPLMADEFFMVHMNEDWMAVRVDIHEDDCMEKTGAKSQGWFPIGNSCAKKMNEKFVRLAKASDFYISKT